MKKLGSELLRQPIVVYFAQLGFRSNFLKARINADNTLLIHNTGCCLMLVVARLLHVGLSEGSEVYSIVVSTVINDCSFLWEK